ncbi:hypothetical protein H8N03_14160 [Ramlibacter sp. USB13]|uniref:Uncharacterized protein n=1 Tax=Ramlibacter cellulosilyticus TaxID=2764187 RepID=A0A923SFM0_9BURK|nr:hypothetical protein [Ramlibacter cellulosilyticus]MBC5784092.1 hypothetical protein [Ramlibacter cellulosilyticus]
MRRWPASWRGNASLAWLAVAAYAAAAAWPHLAGHPIPLLGLRSLSNVHVGVPLVFATLALAVFLSVPAWTTRDRMLVCAGAALCLFAVVAYAVGASAALPFAFIGGNILRESRHPGPRSSPLWAETQ